MKNELTLEQQLGRKPTREELEKEIEHLKHRPTIYEILKMPLIGLSINEAKYYLKSVLDNLEKESTVN